MGINLQELLILQGAYPFLSLDIKSRETQIRVICFNQKLFGRKVAPRNSSISRAMQCFPHCLDLTRDRSSRHINANSLISDSSHQEDPAPDVSAGELLTEIMVFAILDDCHPPDISSGSSPGGVAKHLKRKTGSRRRNVTTEELDPDRDISR